MASKPKNLVDRMKLMLSTGAHADVHFLVGEGEGKELLPAHKSVLEACSEVFEAMFRFDAKKAAQQPSDAEKGMVESVEVPDIDVGAFKTMLSFIYSEDLCGLNGENVIAVFYAAKKYGITGLVEACVAFPIDELSNIFLSYEEAKAIDETDFAKRCLDYIDQNVDDLIRSDQFLQIDQKLLCEILGRDQLEVYNELSIWKAALCWADEQCDQKCLECTAENRRELLGPALYKIRVPLMPKDEFNSIVSSDVLSKDDVISVCQYHCQHQPNFCAVPNSSDNDGKKQYPLIKFCTRKRNNADGQGRIVFKIEKFAEFAREKVGSQRFSNVVYVRGLAWKILARTFNGDWNNETCLGFFLQCNTENHDPKWSCQRSATLRIVSQKEGATDLTKHLFCGSWGLSQFSWGLSQFIIIDEDLMNLHNGWYNGKENCVTLVVDFIADEPKEIAVVEKAKK